MCRCISGYFDQILCYSAHGSDTRYELDVCTHTVAITSMITAEELELLGLPELASPQIIAQMNAPVRKEGRQATGGHEDGRPGKK